MNEVNLQRGNLGMVTVTGPPGLQRTWSYY